MLGGVGRSSLPTALTAPRIADGPTHRDARSRSSRRRPLSGHRHAGSVQELRAVEPDAEEETVTTEGPLNKDATDEAELVEEVPSPKQEELSAIADRKFREESAGLGIPKRTEEVATTDAISTFLTRRFGIAGGLAWLGILAIGAFGEQIKTRLEVFNEEQGAKEVEQTKEIVTASGLRYIDTKVGGGQYPQQGFLTVVDIRGTVDGEVFEDTKARRKSIVFIFGSRPFTGSLCKGVEEALASMKAGGKRRVIVPPELGFGSEGVVLFPEETDPTKQGNIPPNSTLIYELELLRVSIPP